MEPIVKTPVIPRSTSKGISKKALLALLTTKLRLGMGTGLSSDITSMSGNKVAITHSPYQLAGRKAKAIFLSQTNTCPFLG